MKELEEIIICACSSAEHQLLFRTVEFDDDVYVEIHLAKLPFLKRLWYGVKYIFGYQSRYGAFDEVIITKEHLPKLKRVVKWLELNHNAIQMLKEDSV